MEEDQSGDAKFSATPNSEEDQTRDGEFGATPNLDDDEIKIAEAKAVDLWTQLGAAEKDRKTVGIAFGHALIDFHSKAKHGQWMRLLEELGWPYDKARYWMLKAGGKPTDRHKTDDQAETVRGEAGRAGAPDWDAAAAELMALKDAIWKLKQSEPEGANRLEGPLASLAEILGCELKTKGGGE